MFSKSTSSTHECIIGRMSQAHTKGVVVNCFFLYFDIMTFVCNVMERQKDPLLQFLQDRGIEEEILNKLKRQGILRKI